MSKTLIFPEEKLVFTYASDFGAYASTDYAPGYSLEAGETYTVRWDGVEYARTGHAFVYPDGSQCVGIGNPIAWGEESNTDSFCVVYDVTHGIVHYVSMDQGDAHTVAIWQGADPGIVLKNRTGEPVTYVGAYGGVRIPLADGSSRLYVDADEIPTPVEKTVALDFSGGDMVITPDVGAVFSKLLIPRPANHISENIRDGVELSGILGTMKAGGGGGEIVHTASLASVSSNGEKPTITHNLGVIPDLVFGYSLATVNNYPFMVFACSGLTFPEANTLPANLVLTRTSSGISSGSSGSDGIENIDSALPVYNANEATISIGGPGLAKGTWLFYIVGGIR